MGYALIRVKKIWHYRFQIEGNRTQKSTRETVRYKAESIAQKAYDDAKLWARGETPIPSLSELIAQWLDIHRSVCSDAHTKSVETFARLHLYDLATMSVNHISTEAVELARNEHLKTHAPASVNHWLRILKLICIWGVKRGVIPKLPWSVGMLKVQKRPRMILPVASVKIWIDEIDARTIDTPSIATAVRLMFGLGLRESEATGARWEWLDWGRQTYTPGKTKGRESEPIPVPEWLINHLQQTRADSGLIAPRADGAAHPSGFAREAMRAANKVCGTKGLTPHRLRGTFATLLSEAGVPIQMIQAVMRHKSPLTTMGYLEKNLVSATMGQARIAQQIGFSRQENGKRTHANPHEQRASE